MITASELCDLIEKNSDGYVEPLEYNFTDVRVDCLIDLNELASDINRIFGG